MGKDGLRWCGSKREFLRIELLAGSEQRGVIDVSSSSNRDHTEAGQQYQGLT